MNHESQMSYQPVVGDKVKFIMWTRSGSVVANEGDTGVVVATDESHFFIRLDKNSQLIHMTIHGENHIPHDLTRIEYIERVPTPCRDQVDIDKVIRTRGLEDIPSCSDVSIKALTLHLMCREIRKYRLEEKARQADEMEAQNCEV